MHTNDLATINVRASVRVGLAREVDINLKLEYGHLWSSFCPTLQLVQFYVGLPRQVIGGYSSLWPVGLIYPRKTILINLFHELISELISS